MKLTTCVLFKILNILRLWLLLVSEMSLREVKSKKGNKLLELDGYLFRKTKQKRSMCYWICCGYDSRKCKSSLITEAGKLISQTINHDHAPARTAIEARKLMSKRILILAVLRGTEDDSQHFQNPSGTCMML